MNTNSKLMIAATIPLMIAILVVGLGQLAKGQSLDESNPVQTDITSQFPSGENWVVLMTVTNNLDHKITITDVSIEAYDSANNLVGLVTNPEFTPVAANGYSAFKVVLTPNDVAISLDDVDTLISGANYLDFDQDN